MELNQTGKSRKYVSNASGYPPDVSNIQQIGNSNLIGKSRQFVSSASGYPPDSFSNQKMDEIECNKIRNDGDSNQLTFKNDNNDIDTCFENSKIEISIENYPKITVNDANRHICAMELNENSISNQYSSYRSNGQFIDTNVKLLHRNATSNEYLNALDNSDNDIIRHANDLHIFLTHEIDSKDRKWWITVPVRKIDKSIEYIRVLADPGANIGCVNTKWAIDRYRDYIVKNNKTHTIDTPNGKVHPEYAIYLKLPTKTGDFYRAKFVLLDDLPTPILADINMLEAFGYKFRDEIPPVFSHPAEFDLDLNIKVDDRYLVHSYPTFEESKNSNSEFDSDDMKECEKLNKKDAKRQKKWNDSKSDESNYNNIYHIYKLNKIHNFDDSGHIPLIDKIANDSETVMFDESYKHSVFAMHDSDFINDYERYASDLIDLQQRPKLILRRYFEVSCLIN